MSKSGRAFIAMILLALAAFGGWKAYNAFTSNEKAAAEKAAARFYTIANGDIKEEVTAQGKLEAKEYVDVGTQVSGQIQKIHVDFGDEVTKGELLVEIDPRIYQTKVAADEAHIKTLQAQLAQAGASLVLAQQQYDRNAQLVKSSAVSRDLYQQSKAALNVARANIAAFKAQIAETQATLDGDQTNLAYTKIRAPMSGTVVDIPMRQGQTVNASQTAPTILRIANLDVMTVRAQVAEADVMSIKKGMPATFMTMGQMDRTWPGKVRQILPTPEIVNDVVLYDVLIDSPNKGRLLMTGMDTQVFFTIGKAENVPLVPVAVLTHRQPDADNAKGDAYLVSVLGDDGRPQKRVIHVGLMNRTDAEVTEGLVAGDKIILSGAAAGETEKAGGHFRFGPRL